MPREVAIEGKSETRTLRKGQSISIGGVTVLVQDMKRSNVELKITYPANITIDFMKKPDLI